MLVLSFFKKSRVVNILAHFKRPASLEVLAETLIIGCFQSTVDVNTDKFCLHN